MAERLLMCVLMGVREAREGCRGGFGDENGIGGMEVLI